MSLKNPNGKKIYHVEDVTRTVSQNFANEKVIADVNMVWKAPIVGGDDHRTIQLPYDTQSALIWPETHQVYSTVTRCQLSRESFALWALSSINSPINDLDFGEHAFIRVSRLDKNSCVVFDRAASSSCAISLRLIVYDNVKTQQFKRIIGTGFFPYKFCLRISGGVGKYIAKKATPITTIKIPAVKRTCFLSIVLRIPPKLRRSFKPSVRQKVTPRTHARATRIEIYANMCLFQPSHFFIK